METANLYIQNKISKAIELKEFARIFFKNGDFQSALKAYDDALEEMQVR